MQQRTRGSGNVLVVIDVFSRFVWAVPMPSKSQEATAQAFQSIMEASGRKPTEVDSDGGAELSGAFDELSEDEGIAEELAAAKAKPAEEDEKKVDDEDEDA